LDKNESKKRQAQKPISLNENKKLKFALDFSILKSSSELKTKGTMMRLCIALLYIFCLTSVFIFCIPSFLPSVPYPPNLPRIQTEKKENKAKLYFFTAVWCGPCKKVKKVLNELPEKYSDLFELIDIDYDQSPELVNDYQVEELPTMLLFDSNDKLLIRVNGATKEGLDALIVEIKSLKKSSSKHFFL